VTRSPTILLVEDSPADVELTLRAFRKTGIPHDIVVVGDGEEALTRLFSGGRGGVDALPALVLLDLNLPKIDGLEVLRRLRADERTKRLPVVILSSSNEESDVGRGYDLGANSFVRKPVDFDRFVETTRQLGLYWLVLNEPPAHR